MRICLFEDRASSLEPLALTRPVFDLICGQTTLAAKQLRYFSASESGVLIRSLLADVYREMHTDIRVNDLSWLRAERTILVNARWLPPAGTLVAEPRPCVATVGQEVAFAVVDPDDLQSFSTGTIAACLQSWKKTWPNVLAEGTMISYPWDLVQHNGEQLELDFACNGKSGHQSSVSLVGPSDRLYIDPTATVDPLVVADTTAGAIYIDAEANIGAFSRLEGPCYIGPKTQVFGAKIRSGTTLGPECRIGGEIEASIIHGYTNKAHDGFLGHSYLGEWVNLGAGTQTSDLRNDYGKVTVTIGGREIPTGLMKVGSFLGDHTKTGLGALLNTGSTVGIFCNLLPAGALAPKYVPSFTSWWKGELRENFDETTLLHTARQVMSRRGMPLSKELMQLYTRVMKATELDRRQVFYRTEQLRLRRSA